MRVIVYLLSDVSPVLLGGPLLVFLGLVDLELLLVQLVLQVGPGQVEGLVTNSILFC